MNNTSTSTANASLKNAPGSSNVPSKAEGIALCSALIFTCVFIVVGNSLTIILFTVNKTLRKKSLFLVINMAFADLVLGAISLPVYIYADVGNHFQLWTDRTGGLWNNKSFSVVYMIVDTVFSQASLISAVFISCERFYAIYWPFKHRTLSIRAYRIVISMVWTLALLLSAVWTASNSLLSYKYAQYAFTPYTLIVMFIICCCNVSIWRKFQHGSVASQQQNRAAQNNRLTKTLLFVSVLALLCWLPLTVFNYLIYAIRVPIPRKFYFMVNVLNYSSSFANPVVYALRIPEFRQALGLCCIRRGTAMDTERIERRNMAAVLTPATELRTLRADPSHLQLAFEEDVTDINL